MKKSPLRFAIIAMVGGFISCIANNANPLSHDANQSLESLGHYLFFDNKLSFNQTKSCASCHDPKFAFTDGYRRSITASGDRVLHNAPSLINVSYHNYFDWANPEAKTLTKQSERPLFSVSPIEMGLKGHEDEILRRLRDDAFYSRQFKMVFPTAKDPFSIQTIKASLEAYVKSLRSMSSPYDRYTNGDSLALTGDERIGMKLFFSDRLKCSSCHQPPFFTNAATTMNTDSIYFNTGLYNIQGTGAYPTLDNGLRMISDKAQDDGRFKTPSLRNIGFTAPYTHDGSVNTLDEMIEIYKRGGRKIEAGPNEGDGKFNQNKNRNIAGFDLTPLQKKQLIDFLLALTDSTVLVNPAFQNPFPGNK